MVTPYLNVTAQLPQQWNFPSLNVNLIEATARFEGQTSTAHSSAAQHAVVLLPGGGEREGIAAAATMAIAGAQEGALGAVGGWHGIARLAGDVRRHESVAPWAREAWICRQRENKAR